MDKHRAHPIPGPETRVQRPPALEEKVRAAGPDPGESSDGTRATLLPHPAGTPRPRAAQSDPCRAPPAPLTRGAPGGAVCTPSQGKEGEGASLAAPWSGCRSLAFPALQGAGDWRTLSSGSAVTPMWGGVADGGPWLLLVPAGHVSGRGWRAELRGRGRQVPLPCSCRRGWAWRAHSRKPKWFLLC